MKVFLTLISAAGLIACTLNLQGCAVHLSTNWVDSHKEESEQVEKPMYCRLFSCEASNDLRK